MGALFMARPQNFGKLSLPKDRSESFLNIKNYFLANIFLWLKAKEEQNILKRKTEKKYRQWLESKRFGMASSHIADR